MDTATATALGSISHNPTKRPDGVLTRKSTSGESDYLLEFLTDCGGLTRCNCLEYVLSGGEYPCLKRRIAKLRGITYESASQMHKCTCGGAWRKPVGEDWDWLEEQEEPEDNDYCSYFPSAKTGDGDDGGDDDDGGAGSDSGDSGDSGINTDHDESHSVEPTKPSYKSGEDPETGGGAIATVDSEAAYCEEHGGWKGNPEGLCDRCAEEQCAESMYCEEHGGWAGNLKRLCGACKDVYGDPFLCTSDDCPYAATGHWRQ